MVRGIERAAIVGATGPTGRALAEVLRRRGVQARAISRSQPNLMRCFAGVDGVELHAANARNPDELRTAVSECDVVFDCVGMAPGGATAFVAHARGLAEVVREHDVRCVQVSSYWSYVPLRAERIDESHPRAGGNPLVRARRNAEDALAEAGAAIAQLPDFFGPNVHTSTIQNALRDAVAGRKMSWIGSLDHERDYAWVPDAMRLVADLATREESFGERWLLPGSGPITPNRIRAIASRHLGREVKARGAGIWMLRLAGLFSTELRAFAPMIPTYARPLSFDTSKLRRLLGEWQATDYETAIPATLDAIGES